MIGPHSVEMLDKPRSPKITGWGGSRPGSRHMAGPADDLALSTPPVVQIELLEPPKSRARLRRSDSRRDGSARPSLPVSAAVQPCTKHSLSEPSHDLGPLPPIRQNSGPLLEDGFASNSFSEEQGAGPSHAHLSSGNSASDSGLAPFLELESEQMPGLGVHDRRESEIAKRPTNTSSTFEARAARQTDSPDLFVPYASIPENLPGTGGPERAEHMLGKWRQTVHRSRNSLRKHSQSPPRSRSPCSRDGQSFVYNKLQEKESSVEKTLSLRSTELQEYLHLLSVATSSRFGVWTKKTGSPRPG